MIHVASEETETVRFINLSNISYVLNWQTRTQILDIYSKGHGFNL